MKLILSSHKYWGIIVSKIILFLTVFLVLVFGNMGTAFSATSAGWSNPNGCLVVINYPHPSKHVPGTINTEGSVNCAKSSTRLSLTLKLWEKRWWGYDTLAFWGASSINSSKKIEGNVAVKCRKNSMRATAQAKYQTSNGTWVSPLLSTTVYVSC